ncbi:MAG: carbohydrate ABC transporter permease [Chloroflexi bacterium]|nr:carbohydrate ABC transporter permease [Chloroflexota bacterium]
MPLETTSTTGAARRSAGLGRIALTILMIALVIVMVAPFAWMVSTSLKAQQYILETPPRLLPNPVTLESYTGLFERMNIGRMLFNSTFVAVMTTAGQILFSAMAAFAFSRLQWRGRNVVFTLYLATMMVPSVVLVIPQFILIRQLGWMNTYAALIVPGLFNAFGTFLLRQSFLSLPKDFEEAAYVDGANPFTIFWRVLLPLNLPAIATLVVLSFMGSWNAYLLPLFVARKDDVVTLPVALATLQGGPRALTEWNMVMAGAVITVLPILITYLLAQKWFVSSAVASGIKG